MGRERSHALPRALLGLLALPLQTFAGESLYQALVGATAGKGDPALIRMIEEGSGNAEWERARIRRFEGNMRRLVSPPGRGSEDGTELFILRDREGAIYILDRSRAGHNVHEGGIPLDDAVRALVGHKLEFFVATAEGKVGNTAYAYARFLEPPRQMLLDRVFKICIILMLFFVMVGMGLILTPGDFRPVFTEPRGILAGSFLQWGLMPLAAVAMGRFLGYYEEYPFIFVGMVLVAVSPGGVASNLMTYHAKGDLALSISLTSLSTVLSLFFTPLLLTLYCANVPEVELPVAQIVVTIIALVLAPLGAGMAVRSRWPRFAVRATPFFSALGIVSLVLLIATGIATNLDKFADTDRYGPAAYGAVIGLTFTGIFLGMAVPKLLGVSNCQVRAISMETGLRNSLLAMSMALLLQDVMGDFHGSMFVASAAFGLAMYGAGFIAIPLYRWILPIDDEGNKGSRKGNN